VGVVVILAVLVLVSWYVSVNSGLYTPSADYERVDVSGSSTKLSATQCIKPAGLGPEWQLTLKATARGQAKPVISQITINGTRYSGKLSNGSLPLSIPPGMSYLIRFSVCSTDPALQGVTLRSGHTANITLLTAREDPFSALVHLP
jgi:hypothetical protein